ncbi:MAG: hypothetical protein MK237_05845 [Gemmatimonadetes bacterium]|nr:hypothetical protein [Gemmatimonadota bacterium]
MKAFVKSEELTTTTTFTGYADNVEEYLSASDIFVYPSENEALVLQLSKLWPAVFRS